MDVNERKKYSKTDWSIFTAKLDSIPNGRREM